MGSNPRTRILFYVPELALGGAERQVGRLAAGLDPGRFDRVVSWSDAQGPVGDQLLKAGIPVHYIPLSPDDPDESRRRIRDIRPDIFHSFSYNLNALDVLAAHAAEVPVIVTSRINIRQWDLDGKVQDWELVRNRSTNWVSAVSDATANLAIDLEGYPRQRVTVIHNGVEVPEHRPGNGTLRQELNLNPATLLLGCVANYRAEKGHELLLHAFRQVLDCKVDAHLVCCGLDNRGLKRGLHELVGNLGMERNVTLLDSTSDVDSVYRALDLYIQPSLFEGFSNAILEAMAHALPVVATHVGGNPEAVLQGVTGLLTPPCDPPGIADAVLELLADPERRRAMGESGFARCRERFQASAMVSGYARLYEELMRAGKDSSPPADVAVPPESQAVQPLEVARPRAE